MSVSKAAFYRPVWFAFLSCNCANDTRTVYVVNTLAVYFLLTIKTGWVYGSLHEMDRLLQITFPG